jgi:UDP-glucose 4-epimerase
VLEGDIRNPADLDRAFAAGTQAGGSIAGVIHVAGLKAVGESVQKPLLYWDVNLNGSRLLVEAMRRHGCRTLVFSSTATVYGEPEQFSITEAFPTNPLHPCAQTKLADQQAAHFQPGGHAPEWPHRRRLAGHHKQPVPFFSQVLMVVEA